MFEVMKPLLILLTCFYGWGSQAFESIRPEPINVPLRGFHHDVNTFAAFGARTFEAIRYEASTSARPVDIPGRVLTAIGREVRTFSEWR